MSENESVCSLHNGNDCALENPQEHLSGQIVHRYVNNFHIHKDGEALKCGNCGAQKTCSRCSVAKVGKHQCEVCGIWISNVGEHSRVHTGERPFACHLCEQSFKKSQHLSLHQSVHRKTQPYLCDKCGDWFSRQNHLNDHQQCVHSTARNFECNQCAKTYKLRSLLMRHYRTKHGCGYDCPDCGERLRTRDAYTQHHTKHVKEKAARASEASGNKVGSFENDDEEAEASGTPII